jgi:hypothetical protein
MTPPKIFTALLLLAASLASHAGNARLQALFDADQADRQHLTPDISRERIAALVARDRARRDEVRGLLAAGELRTAADYDNAGWIFQHGDSTDDYRLAFSFASIARQIEPGRSGWLVAASWDRLMLSLGKRQWYGTQSHIDAATHEPELLPLDETAVTDQDRWILGLHSLAQMREDLRRDH